MLITSKSSLEYNNIEIIKNKNKINPCFSQGRSNRSFERERWWRSCCVNLDKETTLLKPWSNSVAFCEHLVFNRLPLPVNMFVNTISFIPARLRSIADKNHIISTCVMLRLLIFGTDRRSNQGIVPSEESHSVLELIVDYSIFGIMVTIQVRSIKKFRFSNLCAIYGDVSWGERGGVSNRTRTYLISSFILTFSAIYF